MKTNFQVLKVKFHALMKYASKRRNTQKHSNDLTSPLIAQTCASALFNYNVATEKNLQEIFLKIAIPLTTRPVLKKNV